MAIEVSDDRMWGAVASVFAAGIGFAVWVFRRFSAQGEALTAMNAQMKSFETRLNTVDLTLIRMATKVEEAHDATIRLEGNVGHIKDDVHQIKEAVIASLRRQAEK